MQLSNHAEGVALALGTLTLAAAVRLVDPLSGRRQGWAWVLLGLAAGLAWWTSQIATMLLGAAALGLLVARPGVLAGPGPYAALGLFGLASLPFWLWNVRHEWATFRHLLTWGGPLPGFTVRVGNVAGASLRSLRDTYWDSRAVPLPPWASTLGWIVVGAVYVPAIGLAAWRLVDLGPAPRLTGSGPGGAPGSGRPGVLAHRGGPAAHVVRDLGRSSVTRSPSSGPSRSSSQPYWRAWPAGRVRGA